MTTRGEPYDQPHRGNRGVLRRWLGRRRTGSVSSDWLAFLIGLTVSLLVAALVRRPAAGGVNGALWTIALSVLLHKEYGLATWLAIILCAVALVACGVMSTLIWARLQPDDPATPQ
jgi:hypothetical protein